MSQAFTESVVEDGALAWLKPLGYAVVSDVRIGPRESHAEHGEDEQMVRGKQMWRVVMRVEQPK